MVIPFNDYFVPQKNSKGMTIFMDKIKQVLNIHVYIAFAIYAVTCTALYIIEKVMYAGSVVTVFIFIAVYPPLFLIGYIVFGKRPLKAGRRAIRIKMRGMFGAIAIVGCIVVGYNFIRSGTYQHIINWQILSLFAAVAVVALLDYKQLMDQFEIAKIDYVSIVFSLLLVVTIIFLLISRPITVNGAKRTLENGGFPNSSFVEHHPPESELLPEDAGPLGAYFFSGANDEPIWVDVAFGEILKQGVTSPSDPPAE